MILDSNQDNNSTLNRHGRLMTTTSITTRIDNYTLKELQDEATQTGISLSNLTKQILTNYAKWDKFVAKAGMIPVAKAVISEVFGRLQEDEVIQLATSVGKNALSDILLFMKGKIDLGSLFSWLQLWLKRNSSAGFQYTVENGIHICVMKHDLGWKWSLYHKVVLELIINEILGRKSSSLDINIAENMLVLKFKVQDK
jgi:hypothetical protein